MPTITEIKQSMPRDKSHYDRWGNPAAYFCARPLSYPVTALFITLGMSANAASAASIVFALLSIVAAAMASSAWLVGGLVMMWLILDCVDGNIARFTRTGSNRGEFLDAMGGYTITAGLYLAIGYGMGNMESLLLGGLASIFSLFSRLILNKVNVLAGARRDGSGDTGSGRVAMWLLSIYNLSGIGMLLLILAILFQHETAYLAFQALTGAALTGGAFLQGWKKLQAS
ncbi:CDP-alcohol phosphatidyltransferase family protein [Pseudomonas nitroreducens]|uniref:CDP-alcohol phosphatidyltransferase family protein n=1 Tax=Pseudomonas TaxID=286 RepID=UPI00036DFC18|nr:CDP-alcohol phosphatidyltransferase family protein [Pseudomonas nitroreducens]